MEKSYKLSAGGKLELLPILENKNLDIWPLLLSLKTFDDFDVHNLVCSKLHNIDARRLEFFIPQLCQMVIDRGKNNQYKSLPLKRFLVNQCRKSVRSALLIIFYFNSAVEDNLIETKEMCKQILKECYIASISGSRDKELKALFPLYQEQVQTHRPLQKRKSKNRKEDPKVTAKLNEDQIRIVEDHIKRICEGPIEGFDIDETVPPYSEMLYAKSLDNPTTLADFETLAGAVLTIASITATPHSKKSELDEYIKTFMRPRVDPSLPRIDLHKVESSRSESPRSPPPRSESPKSPAKSEPPKLPPPRSESPRPPRSPPPKSEPPKLPPPRSESPRPPPRPPPRADLPFMDFPKLINPPRSESPRLSPPRIDPPKVDSPRVGTPRAITPRSDSPRESNIESVNLKYGSLVSELKTRSLKYSGGGSEIKLPKIEYQSLSQSLKNERSLNTKPEIKRLNESFEHKIKNSNGAQTNKIQNDGETIKVNEDRSPININNNNSPIKKSTEKRPTLLGSVQPTLNIEEALEHIQSLYNTIQFHSRPNVDRNKLKEYAKLSQSESDNVLFEHVIDRRLHRDYFHAQLRFVRGLTSISTMLVNLKLPDKETKNYTLRLALKKLNRASSFLKGVYIPIFTPMGEPYRVIRIQHSDAVCLNSRDRVPYKLHLEVISGYSELEYLEEKKRAEENKPEISEKESKKSTEKKIVPIKPPIGSSSEDYKVTHISDYKIIEEWVVIKSDNSPTTSGNYKEQPKEPDILETVFGLNWKKRKEKIQQSSPVGEMIGWDVISVIVKSGDDLRQEQLAMQLIKVFYEVFHEENLPLWLNPYMVLATSSDAGLIETVHDAISIDGLKKTLGVDNLANYFTKAYGGMDSQRYKKAQQNFVESLAAYSLVCYLLQIKDRHNGNILIDREGHIIHIDYGFMLSSSPGNLQFETAPFKLPLEFVEVMGGKDGDMFGYFRTLIHCGFMAVRKHYKKILALVDLMVHAGGSRMACFQLGEATIANLKFRFSLSISEDEVIVFTDGLVTESAGNWRTGVYDNFQYLSNGIL